MFRSKRTSVDSADLLKNKRRSTRKYRRLSYAEMDYSFLESAFFTKDLDEIIGDGEHNMSNDEMQGVFEKFVSSVNLLYFDDVAVAKRMDGVVKKEIEKNVNGA